MVAIDSIGLGSGVDGLTGRAIRGTWTLDRRVLVSGWTSRSRQVRLPGFDPD
jgi:hypothetical protein